MSYRTRPRPAGTPEKVDRVAYLLELLSTGNYEGHKTCYELAEHWKLSFETVRQDASIAGLMLKLGPGEIEGAKAQMAGMAQSVYVQAMARESRVTGLPDYKAALEALKLYGIWNGIADRVAETDNSANAPRGPVKIELVTSKSVPEPTPEPEDEDSKD